MNENDIFYLLVFKLENNSKIKLMQNQPEVTVSTCARARLSAFIRVEHCDTITINSSVAGESSSFNFYKET